MSDETAAPAELIAASPEPAEQPPLPASWPGFEGASFTFNLRDALTDLRFTVSPAIEAATFAAVMCVAVTTDGRISVGLSRPENVREFDEAAEARKAVRNAMDGLGLKAN